VLRPCLGVEPDGGRCPGLVRSGSRCPRHRATTSERGYGSPHQAVRSRLAATLPAPCGYCGTVIQPGERWDAAHVVDGRPEFGYVPAHPRCNQRAKAGVVTKFGG
jgi:hypothetical protein